MSYILLDTLAALENQADSQASDYRDAAQFFRDKQENAFAYAALFGAHEAQMMAAIERGMAREAKRREVREALQKTSAHPPETHV